MSEVRIERDSLGEVEVPASAWYGAQTTRALHNFPVSGTPLPSRLIRALGLVKQQCAETNAALGGLDPALAAAISQAAAEVARGDLDAWFPVDVFQTGSGTSSNMNANEVIANRANALLGHPPGAAGAVHPNDHVNQGQSSNDVFPTAIHVAAATAIANDLVPALEALQAALAERAIAFDSIIKNGRTHLMDATPVRLGQVFGGYARQVEQGVRRAGAARDALLELPLGGSAVGTGINVPAGFPAQVIARLAALTGQPFREADDHFEAQGARDGMVEASGLLRTIAVSLVKIANDLRLLGSGPRAGLAEIKLPAVQPGSSIMPGKVNPVMAEMVVMVGYQVMANDLAVTLGGQGGTFELNACMPIMAHGLLQSTSLLANAARLFTTRCVAGIEADAEHCTASVERNFALATALAPAIGYDAAAQLAKEAWRSGRTVREVARERGTLPDDELDRLLDPRTMTGP